MKELQELKFGDGGYFLDREGDVLPVEDFYELEESSVEKSSEQQERLYDIYHRHGFYPKSARELASIVGIDSSKNKDAAKYLSTIMAHQEKLDATVEDPTVTRRTATKITSEFIGYRSDSRANGTFLEDLDSEIDRAVENGQNRLFHTDLGDVSTRAAIQIIRKLATDDFLSEEPTDQKFKFGEDPEYKGERLRVFLQGADLTILRAQSKDFRTNEVARFQYWTEKLDELRRVTVVQPMAERALGLAQG